jgi:Spy/CpxP family protein refolding chaperone
MKKTLTIVLAVVLTMALAAFVFAAGPGSGPGNCPMAGGNITPEQSQAFTQFKNDILPLKQKMLQLRTEVKTLRTQTPVDWNAVSAKQKEMVDVRIAIQKKAADAGFGGCRGYGRSMGGNGPGGKGGPGRY